jgi:hypothetical protein
MPHRLTEKTEMERVNNIPSIAVCIEEPGLFESVYEECLAYKFQKAECRLT